MTEKTTARVRVRSRAVSIGVHTGETRREYRRIIRDIRHVDGVAYWLHEEIPITFSAIGRAKFPGARHPHLGQVALEVIRTPSGKVVEVGWVRIDPDSVVYD
jgi:hypothetical protein